LISLNTIFGYVTSMQTGILHIINLMTIDLKFNFNFRVHVNL
jgi:hypothetical protein